MAPYADDSTSLSSSRCSPLQHASNPVSNRKLAQLVSKFETMDLVGSRGTSWKQKSSRRRAPLLLPGSKTMSSLLKKPPQATSKAFPGLDALPSSPPKQKIGTSGSATHLPSVVLYPPETRKAAGEGLRTNCTVAETRLMFESGSVSRLKKDVTRIPTRIMKGPLRSTEDSETVLFSKRQPLTPLLSTTLNHMTQFAPSIPSVARNAVADAMHSTVNQTKPSKILPYNHTQSDSRRFESGETGESVSIMVEDIPCPFARNLPSSTHIYQTHHGDHIRYPPAKIGQSRIMIALEEADSSCPNKNGCFPNQDQLEAGLNETSPATSPEFPDIRETVTLFTRPLKHSTLLDSDRKVSSSKTSFITDCSTPGEEPLFPQSESLDHGRSCRPDIASEILFQKSDLRNHSFSSTPSVSHETLFQCNFSKSGNSPNEVIFASAAEKWTPQRIVTPQKVTVTDDRGTESKQGQGTFVREHACPSLRETIGFFESMSYRASLSTACQASARELKKPAQSDIKMQKRDILGNPHGKLKGSLQSLSSTRDMKLARRGETDRVMFLDYPDTWKVNSIRPNEGKTLHTQICQLSQHQHETEGASFKGNSIYKSYPDARKVWESWARDNMDGHSCYDTNQELQYTSLHQSAFLGHEKLKNMGESASFNSSGVIPVMEGPVEAARRRSRRWISRSSGTLVSQAHCKLEQPRPVHANELKRLISLCKMRVVGHKRRGDTE